ncbi:site-2 protease family protein [Candidatus Roizmanbacteria bacterium]|nr:site-2 protease family protein [Candidatus Roizmanbacteria bacterium]
MVITILVFLFILSILVLIHEAGHFFVAKRLGIKVEEFGFGFPPRAFSIKKGETIYSINWLPIGGFVKLYGEDEAGGGKIRISKSEIRNNKEDLNRAFFSKSPWLRALVVIAGVAMNAMLAIVIFYTFLIISGFKTELPLLSDHKFFGVNQKNTKEVVISDIAKNSPAEKAGLKSLIKIVSANGKEIKDVKDFTEIVNLNKGKEIEIEWRDLQTKNITKTKITPRLSPPKNEGALGVALFSISTAVLNYETPVQKTFSGVVHPINLMAYNLDVMGDLIRVSFEKRTAEPLGQGVAGPVGIASVTGSILEIPDLKEKVLGLLNLAGLLSISLAFFNILPIPALDGGRLFFILIEGITGRKINQRAESLIHSLGMAMLLVLMAFITFKDIQKIFVGFFKMP